MSRPAAARTGARRPGPPLGRAAPTPGSTQWSAAAVGPQGTATTLEYKPHHAEVARRNLDAAGLGERVDIRVGAALRLSRPGAVIIGDNVVRGGRVLDDSGTGAGAADVAGIRDYLQRQGEDPRLDGTVLQAVSGTGWYGFAVAILREDGAGAQG